MIECVTLTCAYDKCGKEFTKLSSQKNKKYCSSKCSANANWRKHHPKKEHGNKQKVKKLWENPEYRQHMIDVHKGQKAWNKGRKIATNTGRTRFKKGENLGENHSHWKADNVGYVSLHGWIRRHFGHANKCENPSCKYPRLDAGGKMMIKPKAYHWANKTGKYLRDISDWWMLCSSCHRKDKVYTPKDWLNRLK